MNTYQVTEFCWQDRQKVSMIQSITSTYLLGYCNTVSWNILRNEATDILCRVLSQFPISSCLKQTWVYFNFTFEVTCLIYLLLLLNIWKQFSNKLVECMSYFTFTILPHLFPWIYILGLQRSYVYVLHVCY